MSLRIAALADPKKKYTREQLIALIPDKIYDDGRTKQCHKDECDINKIMARFDQSGTISHLAKFQGVYADFSDFDFHEQTNKLTRGREIFDELPAELRKEFSQSPAAFFAYVNDPANADDLRKKLPQLAEPGQTLPRVASPNADDDAAKLKAAQPAEPAAAPAKPPAAPPADADPPAAS